MKAIKQHPLTHSIQSSEGFADILQNNITSEKSLHSTKHFKANDVLTQFSAKAILSKPSYLTVQVGINEHITLQPEYLQYTNHSCNPNVFFDTENYNLIALKDIEIGDELTFFYPSTEWNMDQPFVCMCGSKNCLHNIRGASHLTAEVLNSYRLTTFIQSLLNNG